jgi:hypothetical protein
MIIPVDIYVVAMGTPARAPMLTTGAIVAFVVAVVWSAFRLNARVKREILAAANESTDDLAVRPGG